VHNAKEKMLETILKDGMIRQTKSQTPKLSLCKILAEHDDNLKITLR